MPSIDLRDGRVGFDSRQKIVFSQFEGGEIQSLGSPALGNKENGLLLAWTQAGGSQGGAQSMFGIVLDSQLGRMDSVSSPEDTSDDGPALTDWRFGNGVNIAWKGSGNNNLNVMQQRIVYDKEWNTFSNRFDGDTRFTSPETSPHRPALCTARWPNFTIFMAWTGEGLAELNFMLRNNDNPFAGAPPFRTEFSSRSKRVLPNETSSSAPAIEALGKGLYFCWRGRGNDQINLLGMNLGDLASGKVTPRKEPPSGQTTLHHPAVAAYRDRVFVAWTGEDDTINLASASPMYDVHT